MWPPSRPRSTFPHVPEHYSKCSRRGRLCLLHTPGHNLIWPPNDFPGIRNAQDSIIIRTRPEHAGEETISEPCFRITPLELDMEIRVQEQVVLVTITNLSTCNMGTSQNPGFVLCFWSFNNNAKVLQKIYMPEPRPSRNVVSPGGRNWGKNPHSKYSRGRQVLTIAKASLSTIDHPVYAPLVAPLTKPKTRVAATDTPRANSC